MTVRPRALFLDALAFLALALALGAQLFLPPVVGLANNGDFGKLLGHYGLGAPFEYEHIYAPVHYTFDDRYRYRDDFYSSETLLILPALALNRLASPRGSFDLRWMGAVHAVVYCASFLMLLGLVRDWPVARRAALTAAVLLLASDVMYVSALNSFYMDTGALLYLLLSIVFFVRALLRPARAAALAFLLASILLVTSKTAHAPLGLVLAALLLVSGYRLWPPRGKRFTLAASAALLVATALGFLASPRRYAAMNLYSMIFTGLTPYSPDPAQDLRELGLDASMAQLTGTHAYSEGNRMGDPVFVAEFQRRTSYARLAWFYLRHPARVGGIVLRVLGVTGRIRPPLGNFDPSLGRPARSESDGFALWSGLKRQLLEGHGGRHLIWIGVLIAGLPAALFVRRRSFPSGSFLAGTALAGLALTELAVSSLTDSLDVMRHFFLFHALADLLLLTILAVVLRPKLYNRSDVQEQLRCPLQTARR